MVRLTGVFLAIMFIVAAEPARAQAQFTEVQSGYSEEIYPINGGAELKMSSVRGGTLLSEDNATYTLTLMGCRFDVRSNPADPMLPVIERYAGDSWKAAGHTLTFAGQLVNPRRVNISEPPGRLACSAAANAYVMILGAPSVTDLIHVLVFQFSVDSERIRTGVESWRVKRAPRTQQDAAANGFAGLQHVADVSYVLLMRKDWFTPGQINTALEVGRIALGIANALRR
jgi:hypothetical protein